MLRNALRRLCMATLRLLRAVSGSASGQKTSMRTSRETLCLRWRSRYFSKDKPRDADLSGCRWLEGAAIDRKHWEFFARCYRSTYAAHRSSPYLNLDFFTRLGKALPDALRMVLAERAGRPIAAALFLTDGETLYGRHWGALEHVPLVHFECCYYQAIEHAIERGLARFEGGAQGEHKIFRGLLPEPTLSAHWLAHPRFARAVEDFLQREGVGITRYVDELREHTPFKKPQEEK